MSGAAAKAVRRIRVLYVDDSVDDAMLMSRMLRSDGDGLVFGFEHATGLSQALRRIREGRVDVVLLDLDLSDSKRLDTLAAVRRCTDLPVVVVSGYSDAQTILDALKGGARDFFVKSRTDASALRAVVRRQAEWWQQTHLTA